MANFQEAVQDSVKNALVAEVNRIVDEESKKAARAVEDRVRTLAGDIALTMFNQVKFDMLGQDMTITVQFMDFRKGE